MRHQRVINHLGRTSSHRKSMLANMATSLILHKRITTTVAKAKALKTYVEPLITKSKEDSTHSRRVVFSYLKDKTAVSELFREVSPKIAERPGGYTRILKTGNRIGDNAEMCILELVDYNEGMLGIETGKAKPSRRRRSSKKSSETDASKTGKTAPEKAKKTQEVKDSKISPESDAHENNSTDTEDK
ncbi:MAG: 50S ribosomal protein L17 [Bacteroidales bacterium]|nr:50S ribosomal protein L17 [Bacteroidales bacterium]